MIIEAPPQIVSQHVCDALEKQGYETVELYLARNIIKTGDTVLDMGSGLGLSSITAAKASGGSRVVGYEADPNIALLAQQNGLLNKVNIEIRNKAVQKIAGSIDFFLADNFLANSAYPIKDAKKVSIQAVAFEEILNEIHPDVIRATWYLSIAHAIA
jgi:FkbM family methyltransferase